jgi:hypothetical protein
MLAPLFIELDRTEAQILAVTLRYWRAQRLGGPARRCDPDIRPEAIDRLLAKLGAHAPSPVPADGSHGRRLSN